MHFKCNYRRGRVHFKLAILERSSSVIIQKRIQLAYGREGSSFIRENIRRQRMSLAENVRHTLTRCHTVEAQHRTRGLNRC